MAVPRARLHLHADTIAHGIGLASPIVTSYLAHKTLFRR